MSRRTSSHAAGRSRGMRLFAALLCFLTVLSLLTVSSSASMEQRAYVSPAFEGDIASGEEALTPFAEEPAVSEPEPEPAADLPQEEPSAGQPYSGEETAEPAAPEEEPFVPVSEVFYEEDASQARVEELTPAALAAPVPLDGVTAQLADAAEVTTDIQIAGTDYTGGEEVTVAYGDEFQFNLHWKLPNGHVVRDGDTFYYQMPGAFSRMVPLSGNLQNGALTIGTYSVSDTGRITIVYDNVGESGLGGQGNVTGRLELSGRFDDAYGFANQNGRHPIELSGGTVVVNIKSVAGSAVLDVKKAAPVKIDDTHLNWVVVLRAEQEHTTVLLVDIMGQYLTFPEGYAPIVTRTDEQKTYDEDTLLSSPRTVWTDAERARRVSGYTCTRNDHGFELQFTTLPAGTYYIRYESLMDYKGAVDHLGMAGAEASRVNRVSASSDQTGGPVEASSSADVEKRWITKDGTSITPTIVEWTVVVNGEPAWDISGYYFKDTPDSHQRYRAGTLTLDGQPLPDSDWEKMAAGTYTFPSGLSTGPHTIVYQTDVIDNNINFVDNVAFIGPAADDLPNSADATVDTSVSAYVVKTHDPDDSLTGQLQWGLKLREITAIFAEEPLVITDTLPANMEYVEGSLEVMDGAGYAYAVQNAIMSDLDNYIRATVSTAASGTDAGGQQTVTFTLLPAFLRHVASWTASSWNDDAQAILLYRTRIIDQTEETAAYTNRFSAEHEGWPTITGADTATHTNRNFVVKNAVYTRQTAPYVDYTVYVNAEAYDKRSGNLVVTDVLGSSLSLVMGSIRVYDAGAMTGAGRDVTDVTTDDDVELTGFDYSYDFSTRTITIRDLPMNKALKITYRALLDLAVGQNLTTEGASNTVTATGVVATGASDSVSLMGQALDSSGSSSGESAAVRLYKYSGTSNTLALSGAVFQMEELAVDHSANAVSGVITTREGTTDENGYLLFGNLIHDHLYRITEKTAPDGYLRTSRAYYVVFEGHDDYNWSTLQLKDETGAAITLNVMAGDIGMGTLYIPNSPDAGVEVRFVKKDSSDQWVAGALLRVSGGDADPVAWTTVSGESQVVRLQPGNYTLEEVSVPFGYQRADPISFAVGTDGTVTVSGQTVSQIIMTDRLAQEEAETTPTPTPTAVPTATAAPTDTPAPTAVPTATAAAAPRTQVSPTFRAAAPPQRTVPRTGQDDPVVLWAATLAGWVVMLGAVVTSAVRKRRKGKG